MGLFRRSLVARLTLYFFLLSLLAVAVIGYLAYYQARQTLEESIFERLSAVTELKETELNRWVTDRRSDVEFLARSVELSVYTQSLLTQLADGTNTSNPASLPPYLALHRYLLTADTVKPDLQEIFLIDISSGDVILSTIERHEGQNVSTTGYFQAGLKGTTSSSVYIAAETNRPAMTVASPVKNGEGVVIAVLAAHLDLNYMDRVMLGREGLGSGEAYLIDNQRNFIAARDRVAFAEPVTSLGIDTVVNSKRAGFGVYLNHEGIPVLGAYTWLGGPGLGLLAEVHQAEAFAPARQLGFTIVQYGLPFVTLLALIIYWLVRQLTHPIQAVTKTAVQVSGGDLYATAEVLTEDEIGTLARTFNQMTERLRRSYDSLETKVTLRTAELAKRVQQLNVINQVGRSANSVLELNTLLPSVASLIRNRFNYYAVTIMLLNEETQELFLSAADSVENITPYTIGWNMPLETASIVGYVARTGRPLVVEDVENDSRYLRFEFLPHTRSELALPLSVGEKVLGVLDLQSIHPNGFNPDDVQVLQTLCDQIAVAIRNADLFQTAQFARAEAEEANRLKSQFLANMSHELRTPLNAVINFAYLLIMGVEGQPTAGQKDMLNRIMDGGQHLLGVVNDILDLAKIESGRIEMFLEKVQLQDVIKGVMSTAVGLVRGKPIELHQEVPADLPPIRADRGRIRQILLNLVSNAAKFTDNGHISVRAWADETWVTVSVKDSGIGMAPEDIPKAFAEFVQLDGGLTRRIGGTGLGLPISQKFVEMHGGRIWAESELHKGTTFYVTFPRSNNGELN